MIVNLPDQDEPVEVDAQHVEVEEGDPFLTQEEVDGVIQKRLSRKESNLRSELKEDDEFFQEAAKARGIELREDGRPKGAPTDDELQQLKQKASKAEALEGKVEEYEQRIEESREQELKNTLIDKAPPPANETARDTFVREARSEMTYDDEFGWVKTDENGEIEYRAGEPVGPDQVIAELEDTHNFLFESTTVDNGSDVNPGNATGGPMTQTKFEQEVKKAAQNKDFERMEELEEMEAENKIIED